MNTVLAEGAFRESPDAPAAPPRPRPAVVSPTLLTDQVFNALRTEIVNGALGPGARLRVREISERMGTSPMPVREAILRLEEAGLADRVPHRGAVVKAVTLTDLLHIYNIRILLEVEAAKNGAAAADAGTTTAMQRALTRMQAAVAAGEVMQSLELDEELLSALYRAQPNQHLAEIIANLWRRCRVFKILGARAAQRDGDESLWTYQVHLLEAVACGDHRAAAAITQDSLTSARRRIEQQIAATQHATQHT